MPVSIPDTYILQQCVPQQISVMSTVGVGHLTFPGSNPMTLFNFKRHAELIDHPQLTLDQQEAKLWKDVFNGSQSSGQLPIYAVDNEVSRFPADWKWNLNHFEAGSIISGQTIPGINTTSTNFGMYGTFLPCTRRTASCHQ